MVQTTREHTKAFIVNDLWAKIFSTLLCAMIIGGVSFAWNVRGETDILKTQVASLQSADLPSRMDKLETKVDYTNQSVTRIESQQNAISSKIDYLVQHKRNN